jgi:hypothetical protein
LTLTVGWPAAFSNRWRRKGADGGANLLTTEKACLLSTHCRHDKDRFRQNLGGAEEAFQEVPRRLRLLQAEEDSAVLGLDSHRNKRDR